jgi:hypothetical protein
VLDVMDDGVGVRYLRETDFAVPKTPHADFALQARVPPVKPVLKETVMDELSALADSIVVKLGLVQVYDETGV